MKNIRLKDLNNISSDNVDYATIMSEVCGYTNTWISKRVMFKKKFVEAYNLVQETRQVDITKIDLSKDVSIKIPQNIDNITFVAMMEIQSLSDQQNEDIQEYIANIITKACFSENYSQDYSSSCGEYNDFKKLVLESSLFEMMGVYNWIIKSLDESNKNWKQRFLSVHIDDADYQQADAGSLSQFNVIKTIKNLCKDFNVTYSEAWQLSYALTQTSSYEIATQGHVQDKLRTIKEAKMKQSRNKGY